MAVRLLRLVYAIEFFVALMATLSVWREVGGQYHLDLMPWYVKIIITAGVAGSAVKITATSMAENRRIFFVWASVIAFLLAASGLITYYYHLNEPMDEDQESTILSAFANPGLTFDHIAEIKSLTFPLL